MSPPDPTPAAASARQLPTLLRRARLIARTLIPRVMWTVVERDGRSEFVIWRQWLGNAYGINSIVSMPGRYDRETWWGKDDKIRAAYSASPLDPAYSEGDDIPLG